ncbi:MAG: methylmalonyl Co-A mutase-associated GTPase MeaB [Desulfobacterales bacterium]|nr:methylmalonyl Co-A mutase-associated GTPase MeaB [Desulfobacterales bacterium]
MPEDAAYYIEGVRAGNRKAISKTITLIESALSGHQELVYTVLDSLLPYTGNAIRLGITGVPGVGKSTFIETLGMRLIEKGHRVAILAVDPSSAKSGGSILGDKTRMEKLAAHDHAFIRPSPSGGALGGVARKTRETMTVLEAAGYDVIMVETVGVGQSEFSVASMVDFFLVLLLAGAGDELQGIKRGIIELADAMAVNKADGENAARAEKARKDYENALHLMAPRSDDWQPPVLTCSALEMTGIDEIWETVLEHHRKMEESGELAAKRRRQARDWFDFLVEEGLKSWFYGLSEVKTLLPDLTRHIEQGDTTAMAAARQLLALVTHEYERKQT